MKSLFLQKLPLADQTSFVARTFRTPHFEVSWHQHIECELILFTEGAGQAFIGNYIGNFETGDIFFLGPNLPHTFQKNGDQIASAVVVQFREDFWGTDFLNLPESEALKDLLATSLAGLRITGPSRETLHRLIRELEYQKGFERILTLGRCLQILSEKKEFMPLSTRNLHSLNAQETERVNKVFRYTLENFREDISLSQVAALVGLSIPAFCAYFKKRAHKSYINFLHEVRIGYACGQLAGTSKSVSEIGYEAGFNAITNFHRQFRKLKGKTPLEYRNDFLTIC